MAQSFHLYHGEPTVTSSPTEVRMWVEELDYSFLAYGENFERAEINGEKLLSITRQKLKELGVTWTEHQDIILKTVANINKKTKLEDQGMQGEDKNNKMLPTRFKKQSELLEHVLGQLLDAISERRRARILYGSNEDPPYNILTAALELINVVKMILNILERPPLDCMSEFSSLKNHLIKHITLLKHFSEQSDLNNEMESDMIDMCKKVTKMCHYIIALPPEITGPEELTLQIQVPVAIECKAVTFSFEHGPDYMHPTLYLSMPVTAKSSSSEHVLPLQDMSLQNKIVPCRSEYVSPETLNTPSYKDTVMSRDEDKSETEVSNTKGSDTSAGSFDYKILQDLLIIENVSPMPDSGSEICEIDSDSDRGIGLDYDLEQEWKDSDSVIWGVDSDSEICPIRSDSVKHLLEAEIYPRTSDSVKDLMESEQHLGEVGQFQMDYDPLKYWGDSDSEKCLEYSDSEKCLMDSDNESPEIDSDSEKRSMASVSVKHLLETEKFQMASDSIKRLMDSKKRLMDVQQHCIVSESEEYVMDSSMETDKIGSASASGVHLIGKEKYQKTRSKSYRMDLDSEPCRVDSDLERHALATTAAKCLIGTKTYQLSTYTEGHSWDLDYESLGRGSDSVKHKLKAKRCQSKHELERFWMDLKCKSEKSLTDSERQQLNFDYDRCRDSSRRYQHRSARFQDSSERCQVDFKKHWDNFERHQLDSNSKKHSANSENEKSNELESERHMMEREREQCLIQFENKRLQLDEEQENYGMDSDREEEHQITPNNERQRLDSENEAQRLGARKKDNRPPDYWRPVFLSPSFGPAKKTEEKHSIQRTGHKAVSRIQHVRHLNDEKIVRRKEISPTPSNKEDSQQKFKEMHSRNLSPGPKHQRNASYKISVYKSHYKEYRWLQSFQSSGSQINPFNLLNAEDYTAEVSTFDCYPTSMSTWSAVRPKIHRYSSDTRATICSKYSKEITNSHFHKCLMDSDNDSDPNCPPHNQIPLGTKYCLSPKSTRHHNTSWNSPLSRSMDPKHSVSIHCPLRQRDSKYSLSSISSLHCGSCLNPPKSHGLH